MYMEDVLCRAIYKWYTDSFVDWKSIDNPDWINYVCKEINITETEYKRIMMLEE